MPLHNIDNVTLREKCRSRIESLEVWLRRVINEEFTQLHGPNFINFQNENRDFLIKKHVRDNINARYSNSPKDFARLIDAAFFENLIDIFCNPNHLENIFKKYLNSIYPHNMPHQYIYLEFCLSRLKAIRNTLSHANEISVRNAEFVLSTTTEYTESFKQYYYMEGKQQEYNVPQIIKITDSFGNVIIRRNFQNNEIHDFSTNPNCYLRPGDIVSIEVEVDPSYTDTKYKFRFGGTSQDYDYNNRLVYTIRKQDVQERKPIHCQVRSDKDWHKHSHMDDQITIYYKILPPIED